MEVASSHSSVTHVTKHGIIQIVQPMAPIKRERESLGVSNDFPHAKNVKLESTECTDNPLTETVVIESKDILADVKQENEFSSKSNDDTDVQLNINNVVGSFSVRCHLHLKDIATRGYNVEHRRAQSMLNMKLRKPRATASIWSSGKITITGADSEDNCKIAARRVARVLQKLGYTVKFSNFRVVNVLGTCSLPFGILINDFSSAHKRVEYEPELHPGATYTIPDIKATLKIFSTGSITITAPRVHLVHDAVMNVFPLVYQHKTVKRISQKEQGYMQKLLQSQESDFDDDDLELEYGEIPSKYSARNAGPATSATSSNRGPNYNPKSGPVQQRVVNHEDIYGSDSEDDENLSDISSE